MLGKAFRAQSIQLAPGATVFGVGDRLSNAFARAGAEPLREPNWDPFETDAVGVRVDLVMRAPDSDNAEAATSWRRPPDRTCRLGTVHAVCLWSKPNYRGDLVTMPIGSDRLVIHRAGFAARSLQAHGDVNLWGYVGNDPYQVIGMSLGGDGSSGVSEPDLDALLPDGFSRTEVVNFWPLSSTT